ncbi:4-hydroxybenzoyl-CoA thioesterase domain-containing protein [Pseudomonas coronafaciens pv. garcae]|nr:4-hydroxybenzoyl-CoA thioesterase domain-containing protein [Pseudomonas coronafaciens pv. garcae]
MQPFIKGFEMSMWRQAPDIETLMAAQKNTIGEVLDIRFESFTEDSMTASMVVDQRTHQPFGLLHGGASVVLAESLGSMASYLMVDPKTHFCVGLEVNANLLRGVRTGRVTGVVRPVHIGRTTHVWDIRISTDEGKLSCISRLTVAVVPHGQEPPAH